MESKAVDGEIPFAIGERDLFVKTKLNTPTPSTQKPRNEEPITSELNFADFSSQSSQPSQLLSMAPSHTASKI
jgi:hypothetical protein